MVMFKCLAFFRTEMSPIYVCSVSVKGPCVVCGAPGYVCPICESSKALYCTTGHRYRDWDRHKSECKILVPTTEVNNNESQEIGEDGHLKLQFNSVHGVYAGAAKTIPKHDLVMERQPCMIGPVSMN